MGGPAAEGREGSGGGVRGFMRRVGPRQVGWVEGEGGIGEVEGRGKKGRGGRGVRVERGLRKDVGQSGF